MSSKKYFLKDRENKKETRVENNKQKHEITFTEGGLDNNYIIKGDGYLWSNFFDSIKKGHKTPGKYVGLARKLVGRERFNLLFTAKVSILKFFTD